MYFRAALTVASAEPAVLKAKKEQITADAEVHINTLDLSILKQAEGGKAAAMLWGSAFIYNGGFFVAYLRGPILERMDR